MMILKQLPKCSSVEQAKCFVDALHDADENITVKPCTKLQYRAVQAATWEGQPNQARYILRQEPMVTVKREYLICDVMALISFIGGVMGICIGTSLFSLSGETLNFIESAIKWRNSRKCRDIAKEENVNNSLTQVVSTSDFVRETTCRDNRR